jgi:ABC-type multidrug transport system fused ATPase/permease subunit
VAGRAARVHHQDRPPAPAGGSPLIILDEPTAWLDARAEAELFDKIRSLFRGRSVLLISHRFSGVRSPDRIYVMREGEVIEHGSHEDLMQAGGL